MPKENFFLSDKKPKWVSWNDHGTWRVGTRIGGPSFDFSTMTQEQAYAIKDLFNRLENPKITRLGESPIDTQGQGVF